MKMKVKPIAVACLVMLLLSGCADRSLTMEKQEQESATRSEENEQGIEEKEDELVTESTDSDLTAESEEANKYALLEPKEFEYQEGYYETDFSQTILNENLYEEIDAPMKEGGIEYPDIELKPELEDYMVESDWDGEGKYDDLVAMFYDYRTLEIGEEALLDLFIDHGYFLYFHYGEAGNLNFRVVEIQERDGLSIYPCRILIQSWDENYIYVIDITADIPRKVRNLIVIDDREFPQIILHAAGFDGNFTAQEELIFFKFKRTGWVPCYIDLEFEEHEQFVATYYSDGIAFSPGRLTEVGRYVRTHAYQLGALEEVEKNRHFRMMKISVVVGVTVVIGPSEGRFNGLNDYIDFYIAEE